MPARLSSSMSCLEVLLLLLLSPEPRPAAGSAPVGRDGCGLSSDSLAGTGLQCNCSFCTEALADLCCRFSGIPATLLAFEEDDLWGPRLEEFNGCTGAKVTLTYTPEGEDGMQAALEADVGVHYVAARGVDFSTEGAGIYDSYIVQAPWIPAIVDGLENLSPRIAQAPSLDWLDVNAISRQIVSFNNTVRALPLDVDYIAFGYRADVFERWGKSPPETLEELVELSEFFSGKDHNDDGVPDWGFCLTPQPNYFYAFVTPIMQRTRAACEGTVGVTGVPLCNGDLTGQNPFFDISTFEPLLDNPGFKYAFDLHARFINASNCRDQIAAGGSCDRKSAMQSGRCAGVISMPGTMTKLLLPWDQGGKYAPKPRYAEDGETIEWQVGGTSDGGYWGRRMRFPGSTKIYDAVDGQLKDCTLELCPKAVEHSIRQGVLVNYAPFFAEGGEAYALRAQSASAKKDLMFAFFEWLAQLPPSHLPLSGAYRRSQLTPAAQVEMVERGMPEQVADDLVKLLQFLFRDDQTEGSNNVQDLLIFGFADYMKSFGERIYTELLLTDEALDALLHARPLDDRYAAAIADLHGDYSEIDAIFGKVAQLQRWRTSLGLAQLSDAELCAGFAKVSELNAASVKASGINCDPQQVFESGEDVVRIVMVTLGSIVGTLFVMAIALWLARTISTNRRLRKANAELVRRQVEEAFEKVTEIQAPFVVMKSNDFLNFGRLMSYEQVRNMGKLISVDSMGEEMREFLKRHYVVFFSHQWLGWEEPDPNNAQFLAMVAALSALSHRTGLQPEELHVWCDWFSIPQRCRAIQKMAIASLPVFSSVCHCFVAVVPHTHHADTGAVANQDSYHRRSWCRAEVMSHWARRGTENMFYARGDGLTLMAPDGPSDNFLEAIQVFRGDLSCCARGHPGGVPCDKEFLMLPMLGLYHQIYANRSDEQVKGINNFIEPILTDVFPANITYTSDVTGTITKPLFGDLIWALRSKVHDRAGGSGRWATEHHHRPRSVPNFRPGTTCSAAEVSARDSFNLGIFKPANEHALSRSTATHGTDFAGVTSASQSTRNGAPSDSLAGTGSTTKHHLSLVTRITSPRSVSNRSRCSNNSYVPGSASSTPKQGAAAAAAGSADAGTLKDPTSSANGAETSGDENDDENPRSAMRAQRSMTSARSVLSQALSAGREEV